MTAPSPLTTSRRAERRELKQMIDTAKRRILNVSLMDHQVALVEKTRTRSRFGVGWKPGTGKTIAMLSIIRDRDMPTIILAPRSILYAAWVLDGRKVGVNVLVYHGDPGRRRQFREKMISIVQNNNPLTIVTTYETFRIDAEHLFRVGFTRLIIDESSKLKNPDSTISKVASSFADGMSEVYILSGTMAPNGPHEYWSQLRTISPALGRPPYQNTGAPNFWRWANYWLVPIKRKVPVTVRDRITGNPTRGQKEVIAGWHVNRTMKEQFEKLLAENIWFLNTEDCVDLPEANDIPVAVELDAAEERAFDAAIDELKVIDDDGDAVSISKEARVQKLRQIVAGFAYLPEDRVVDIGTTKRDAVCDILESIGPAEPAVVWGEFRHEIDGLAEAIAKVEGRTVEKIYGGTADIGGIIDRFQRGEINTLVCHPASVGHGATLTAARYAIFASLGWSWELHEQARARIHRTGQRRSVFYYYLLASGTTDKSLLTSLRKKENQAAAINRAVRALAANRYSSDEDEEQDGSHGTE